MLKNKKIKKYTTINNILFISIFFVSNFLILCFLFISSNNFLIEIIKLLQFTYFLIFIFLIFSNKNNKIIPLFLASLIYIAYFILIIYKVITGVNLDFLFLMTNFYDIYSIFTINVVLIILVIFIFGVINSYFLYKISLNFSRKKYLIIVSFVLLIFSFFIIRNNELIIFAKSSIPNNSINYYENWRDNFIKQSIIEKESILLQTKKIKQENFPSYLDNIIILQIESLNGFLVNKKNTPNFIEIAKNGIFFPKFYGNSIQTILGQENILCSVPSSFKETLTKSGNDKKILCLPELLNNLNYKTFFIKSYDLNFTNTGTFTKNIKFNEIHADDLMQDKDIKYKWGYKEDIFYKRSLNYFQKNKSKNKNFLYLEIGPTNHWPFDTPNEFKNTVLYTNPKNHQEKLINTTYLQDKYIKIALDKINEIFPKKNYTLFILGDHSWPAELHKGNTFNQSGSYEENFLTSMIMIIGDETKFKNKIINSKYSQMDIMPSIMDLFGINYPKNEYQTSFIDEIFNNTKIKNKKIILIQPFSKKYINIIKNNIKYQYNADSHNIIYYDIDKDPNEMYGKKDKKNKIENLFTL